MTNYIKSEFYRILHTKGVFILTGVCAAVVLLYVAVLWIMASVEASMGSVFPWATTKHAFSTLEGGHPGNGPKARQYVVGHGSQGREKASAGGPAAGSAVCVAANAVERLGVRRTIPSNT